MKKIRRQLEKNAKSQLKDNPINIQSSLAHARPTDVSNQVPELVGVSAKLERDLRDYVADEEIDADLLSEDLIQALDGQPLTTLESILDYLRHYGKYEISTKLLEEAWHSDLPLSFLGRIAEDWIGTVKFGLNDPIGAEIVSQYLVPKAITLGPSFCHELCDLLLEWKLYRPAIPLAKEAIKGLQGDLSVQYHYAVVCKFENQWQAAKLAFEKAKAQHDHPAIEWNLGIVAVAQRDWANARKIWQKLGIALPDGEGDYAQPGQLCAIRLPIQLLNTAHQSQTDHQSHQSSDQQRQHLEIDQQRQQMKSEVLWGRRLCPARVEITSIPYYHQSYQCGDIVLVDGIQNGETSYQGEKWPIVDVLGKFENTTGQTFKLYAKMTHPKQITMLDEQIHQLSEKGWQIVNWSRLEKTSLCIGIYLPDLSLASRLQAQMDELLDVKFDLIN
jgi:hypothetical protein